MEYKNCGLTIRKRTPSLSQISSNSTRAGNYDPTSYHHMHSQDEVDVANMLSLKVVYILRITRLQTAKRVLDPATEQRVTFPPKAEIISPEQSSQLHIGQFVRIDITA